MIAYRKAEVLSRDEEAKLLFAAQHGNTRARNDLIEAHLPFIRKCARQASRPYWMDVDDAVSAGVLGMIRAIEKYKSNKGCGLLTYSKWWMRAMRHDAIEYGQLFRVPSVMVNKVKHGRRVSEATRMEVIAATGIQCEQFGGDAAQQ